MHFRHARRDDPCRDGTQRRMRRRRRPRYARAETNDPDRARNIYTSAGRNSRARLSTRVVTIPVVGRAASVGSEITCELRESLVKEQRERGDREMSWNRRLMYHAPLRLFRSRYYSKFAPRVIGGFEDNRIDVDRVAGLRIRVASAKCVAKSLVKC